MPPDPHDASHARLAATASRRWMIGIIITVVFGAFGVVMALLSYSDRDRGSSTPAGAPSPSPSKEPARDREPREQKPREREPRDKGKGNDKDDR